MPSHGEATTSDALIVEYKALKQEQQLRIGFRDNLIYATLASLAAVIAAVLHFSSHTALLLLIPPALIILGWTHLVNDEKVSAIGRYIRLDLAPRLMKLTDMESDPFGWEGAHRSDKYRISRKYIQLGVDLGTFCLPVLIALIVYWIHGAITPPSLALSVIEVCAIGGLAIEIIIYADVAKGGVTDVTITRHADGTFNVQTRAGTSHKVSVPEGFPADLGCTHVPLEELVKESFKFLLEREPATSIPQEFSLDIISQRFTDYPAEVCTRLSGTDPGTPQ